MLLVQCMGLRVQAEETGDEPSDLYARSAVLMDADSGRVLFGKEETAVRPMASTTKIMTCILALENMEESQTVTVSDYAASQPKVRLGIRGKEEYYLYDLLYSLMLESHNDSAVAVAEGIAGSVEEFAAMMNDKARKLGCADTYFVTPNGLDGYDDRGTHSTTARDLATIMKYCIRDSGCHEEFLKITQTKTYSFTDVKGGRNFACSNHNAFLDMMEGAISGKTGFTADAGYCYVGALKDGGRTFIVALLACGWPNNKGYKWQDTRKLMEYGIARYEYRDVWQEPPLEDMSVENGVPADNSIRRSAKVPLTLQGDTGELKVLLRDDEEVEVRCKVKRRLKAPVKKGQDAGEVTYLLGGSKIGTYKIVTGASIEKRGVLWCFWKAARYVCI